MSLAEKASPEAPRPQHIPYWRILTDQGVCTPEVIDYPYAGAGTEESPYVVEWIPNDPRNPMEFSSGLKWTYTILVAFATLAVSLSSSAYAGGINEVLTDLHVGEEVATLGVSLFVLGFAVGPLLWAPMNSLSDHLLLTRCILRWRSWRSACICPYHPPIFPGSFGSSPFTNAGGVIADIFPAEKRGLATSLFAGAPFLGPTLGPVIGGFLSENAGWRWVQAFLAIFTGVIWMLGSLIVPETYAPVLLHIDRGKVSARNAFGTALKRRWILLFAEPIVFLLSLYMAIVYGTLYMLFDAFPIVFQEIRGWSEGVGSLPFLAVMVGMMIAVALNMYDNKRYVRIHNKHNGFAPPEARLPPTMLGGIAIPIGLFWFAWTNYPSIPWIVCVLATAPFGFGMVFVFLGIMNYLIDAYTIYAASVLAANSIIRSCFGAGFPLFTTYMFNNLGIHWASCVPAFLSLACVPFQFIFYHYGPAIRRKCKYAAEADDFMRALNRKAHETSEVKETEDVVAESSEEKQATVEPARVSVDNESMSSRSSLERVGTYEANPFDINHVNTRNSAITQQSKTTQGRASRFFGFGRK
ncbi:hypothetical protein N7486_006177 [Penicillium sp. IBT 16267x]|nr:hypothetical protein N7486_006177 [Penicillium sp. IBT 16267x]